jgi:hypothetical protein
MDRKNEAGGRRESNEVGGMERERKKEEEWREKWSGRNGERERNKAEEWRERGIRKRNGERAMKQEEWREGGRDGEE